MSPAAWKVSRSGRRTLICRVIETFRFSPLRRTRSCRSTVSNVSVDAVLSDAAVCCNNSRPRAAEVLVSGAEARLVRRRESIDALLAAEEAPR